MKRLEDLIDRLKNIEREVLEVIKSTLREYDYEILDMNIQDQLYDLGINRVGVPISDYAPYSPYTIEIKQMKGQPTSRVTLRDEGDFHHSFYIEFREDEWEIKATDWKAGELEMKYGKQIFGLTDENLEKFTREYMNPEIKKFFEEI